MKFGISMFFTDETIQPADLAPVVEEMGFDSLWLPEHSHMPIAQVQSLSPEYQKIYDAFATLAFIAGITSRIRLGTAVSLIAIRDPIWTAKACATIDRLSGGRFTLGVGYGWLDHEIEAHGVSFRARRDIARDNLRIIRALWTEEAAQYQGVHAHLEPSWQWPKPVQVPHPPIFVGAGLGPRTLEDIVEFADGWIPLGRYGVTADHVDRVRRIVEDRAGRTIEVSCYESGLTEERLEVLDAIGCDRVIVRLPATDRGGVLGELTEIAELIAACRAAGPQDPPRAVS